MTIIESIRGEYLRYKKLAEAAMAQIRRCAAFRGGLGREQLDRDDLLARVGQPEVPVHGFPDARWREAVAQPRRGVRRAPVSRAELLAKWEDGWAALLAALDGAIATIR